MIVKVPDKKNCHPYWPDGLRNTGYTGDLEIHEGVCTLVIPRPGASSRDVARDLKLLSQKFEYKGDIESRTQTKTKEETS